MLKLDTPVSLEQSWSEALAGEFEQPYMHALNSFLRERKNGGARIFPPADEVFNAFSHTPLNEVKVVILGQDPYHGEGQAHGLSFSVNPGIAVPPSLKNIYRELHEELDLAIPRHGDLRPWADQGVLMLNSVLTVELSNAGCHRGKGWEIFTDKVIQQIDTRCSAVVFMLWGSYAQCKADMIDTARHCVLKAPHPSPLSAYRGFLGCGHFKRANEFLAERGRTPVNWALPERA